MSSDVILDEVVFYWKTWSEKCYNSEDGIHWSPYSNESLSMIWSHANVNMKPKILEFYHSAVNTRYDKNKQKYNNYE